MTLDRGSMRMDGLNLLPNQGPVSAAPNAGADLRAARERLGWPLEDASATLRIRRIYLDALEDGDLSQLPGNAFALGFLRSYATALGLDPEEMLRRFKAEAAEVSRRTELAFPAPMPDRGLPMGAVILLGLLLAVGAYIGWYRLSGEGRLPAETANTIPERLSPLAQQALPPPSATPDAPQTLPSVSPVSAAAAPVVPVPAPSPAVVPAVVAPAVVVPGAAPPVAPNQSRLVLRASADAWVEVREKGGPVLLNKVLHAGETWPVPARPGLTLTTGNAPATDLLLDGVTTVSLGGSGAVRHDLPLDVDQIKAGKLNPTQATPALRPAQ